jgi:hypothetical protein
MRLIGCVILSGFMLIAGCGLLPQKKDAQGNPILVPPCPEGTEQKGGC